MLQWLGMGDLPGLFGFLSDYRVLLLMAPFAWGMLFCFFKDRVPIDDRLGVAAALIAGYTYARGGWLVVGQYAFCYALIWFAVRVKALNRWDKYGDFSYGIYIIGWPLMWFATFFDLQDTGWIIYHAVVIVGVHAYAFLSWHYIERPAMALKNWTPQWLVRLEEWMRPTTDRWRPRWRRRLVLTQPLTTAGDGVPRPASSLRTLPSPATPMPEVVKR